MINVLKTLHHILYVVFAPCSVRGENVNTSKPSNTQKQHKLEEQELQDAHFKETVQHFPTLR